MGLLQGPRLMAWTTKSPIRGNHWIPIGCKALLGSVKKVFFFKKKSDLSLGRESSKVFLSQYLINVRTIFKRK